jgi:thymidylate kinase
LSILTITFAHQVLGEDEMFIVEGTDLTSKTTAAKYVAKRLGYTYQHLTRLPDTHDRCWDYLAIAGARTVRDRFHMSEWVYSRARRDGSEHLLSPSAVHYIDGVLRTIPTFTIVITTVEELLRERYEERKAEEMFPLSVVLRANEEFHKVVAGHIMDWSYKIECTKKHPFPDASDLDFAIEQYVNLRHDVTHLKGLRDAHRLGGTTA